MTVRPLLAVVPARGGSKGLPGKNIRPLGGLPLIAHTLRCAERCPAIDRVVVSTDSEEIAAVARAHGGHVPFLRPAELAQDSTPMWPVIQHALAEMERLDDRRYNGVLLLDPTSPGRLPEDIEAAVESLEASPGFDGIVGVSEPPFNPYWHCVVAGADGEMRDLIPGAAAYTRRQDVPPVYRINASLYCWRRAFVVRAANWRDGHLKMHIVPEARALHIDDQHGFDLAELSLQRGLLRLPWMD
jgi:N-acylneuraminate cytidylyltransferase